MASLHMIVLVVWCAGWCLLNQDINLESMLFPLHISLVNFIQIHRMHCQHCILIFKNYLSLQTRFSKHSLLFSLESYEIVIHSGPCWQWLYQDTHLYYKILGQFSSIWLVGWDPWPSQPKHLQYSFQMGIFKQLIPGDIYTCQVLLEGDWLELR